MSYREYIPKNEFLRNICDTLVCDEPITIVFKDKQGEYHSLRIQEILSFCTSDGKKSKINRLWIDCKEIEPFYEEIEEVEKYTPGKHLKTTSVSFSNKKNAVLVEYTDRLQFTIINDNDIKSYYIRKIYAPIIKERLNTAKNFDSILDFVKNIKELQ